MGEWIPQCADCKAIRPARLFIETAKPRMGAFYCEGCAGDHPAAIEMQSLWPEPPPSTVDIQFQGVPLWSEKATENYAHAIERLQEEARKRASVLEECIMGVENSFEATGKPLWASGTDLDVRSVDIVTLYNHAQQTDYARMPADVYAKCEAAGKALKALVSDSKRGPLTMKDAIALAADESGCAREDLCSYLLALGIGSLR